MISPEERLLYYAPLELIFILRTPAIQPGLITWVDPQGQAYFLMMKDDVYDECLAFLESRGCPVVEDSSQVEEFARQLIARWKP